MSTAEESLIRHGGGCFALYSIASGKERKAAGNGVVVAAHQTNVKMATREQSIDEMRASEGGFHVCTAMGAAKSLFEALPESDDYAHRCWHARMGVINTHWFERENVLVANMYAQNNGGGPTPGREDTREKREAAFRSCLERLLVTIAALHEKHGFVEVVMPCGIGCGLARGRPEAYTAMLARFALSAKAACGGQFALTLRHFEKGRRGRKVVRPASSCAFFSRVRARVAELGGRGERRMEGESGGAVQ